MKARAGQLRGVAAILAFALLPACGASDQSAQPSSDSAPTQPPTSAISTAPPSTTPATSLPTTAAFEVGEAIELSDCTPVVPPSRSSTMTLLRLACPELPDSIQFADVSVAGADVDVPSMSTKVYVEGEVVDLVKSGAGFTTIVVAAERIETG